MNIEKTFHQMGYAALIVLAIGIFTSVSLSALSHILLFPTGLYFFCHWLKKRDIKVKKSVWALLAMAIICFVSTLTNLDILERPFSNLFKTKYFFIGFLSFFAFSYIKRDYLDDKKISWILNIFLLSTTLATISGLIALYSGFNPLKMKAACHEFRACGLYGMYMTYGYGIGLFMVLLTGAVIYRDQLKKWTPSWTLYLCWSINLIGLLMSYARGAWIGFLFAVPFYFYKKNKKKFCIAGATGLIVFGAIFIFSEKVRSTVLNREGSNQQRLSFFKASLAATSERPILGLGYRNFEAHSKRIKKKNSLPWASVSGHAHNNYLEHLASTGLIGFLVLLIFCFYWLLESYHENEIIFPFVIAFLTSGMTQYTFGDGENLFLIMGVFGLF